MFEGLALLTALAIALRLRFRSAALQQRWILTRNWSDSFLNLLAMGIAALFVFRLLFALYTSRF